MCIRDRLTINGLLLVMLDVYNMKDKQKTAYEMRISDWSSDVCSSDLEGLQLIVP